MKTFLGGTLASIIGVLVFATPAFAHVIVTPKQVGVAADQEFTMSVPTEKDIPTISIELFMPAGLQDVIPNVKPGWTISEQKTGVAVTAIVWTNGSIPPGQRDDFLFQAQVPDQQTTLKWKAYQTYQDGSVVKWINTPTSNPEDDSAPPPYSTTMVVNDLTGSGSSTSSNQGSSLALILSGVAILLAVVSLGASFSKKK